jgi:site-specific recombinase XerD
MSIRYVSLLRDQRLETKKPETARATLQSYSITISAFLDFLGSKADRDLSEVTRADLIAFRNSLAGKLSSTSINRYISVFAHALQNC